MNSRRLALDYLERAKKRNNALRVLMSEEAYADVIREGQEVLELTLKGILRFICVEPPKKHDVGTALEEHTDRLPQYFKDALKDIIQASRYLTEERSHAFYGDESAFVPASELFTKEEAEKVINIIEMTLSLFERLAKEG